MGNRLFDEKKKICTVHGGEVSEYILFQHARTFLVLGSKFIHSVRIVGFSEKEPGGIPLTPPIIFQLQR